MFTGGVSLIRLPQARADMKKGGPSRSDPRRRSSCLLSNRAERDRCRVQGRRKRSGRRFILLFVFVSLRLLLLTVASLLSIGHVVLHLIGWGLSSGLRIACSCREVNDLSADSDRMDQDAPKRTLVDHAEFELIGITRRHLPRARIHQYAVWAFVFHELGS